jgi:hypothetical protein
MFSAPNAVAVLNRSSATSTRQRPLAAGHPRTRRAADAPEARRQSAAREVTRADLCLSPFLGEEPGDRITQLAQRRLHGAADDLGIHAVVMMGKQVTQPRNLLPRNLRLPREQVRGQRLDGLADHHEPAKQCVEGQLRRFLRIAGLGPLRSPRRLRLRTWRQMRTVRGGGRLCG